MKKYSKQILSLLTLVVVSIVIAQINLQDGLALAMAFNRTSRN